MIKKGRILIFTITSFILTIWAFIFVWPDNKVRLIACDVGQGDAILITKGFNQILVDGGPNNKVLQCLSENMPFWDKDLELVVNTHPEQDHFGGLVDVFGRYNVLYFVTNSIVNPKNRDFWELQKLVVDQKIKVYSPKKEDKIKIAEIELEVLWPQEVMGNPLVWQNVEKDEQVLTESTFKGNLNNISIVMLLKYDQFDALLTGDIDEKIERQIIEEHEFEDIEVLKVAHHGSKYSTSQEFLKAVKPQLAIISVGKNPWGHPTEEVLNRLKEEGVKVLRTDKNEIKLKI